MCNQMKIELLKACENRLHHHLIENGFRGNDNNDGKGIAEISHSERAAENQRDYFYWFFWDFVLISRLSL